MIVVLSKNIRNKGISYNLCKNLIKFQVCFSNDQKDNPNQNGKTVRPGDSSFGDLIKKSCCSCSNLSLREKKVVIILAGRYAGKKAVIVKSNDDGSQKRPYGHCLVAGISK